MAGEESALAERLAAALATAGINQAELARRAGLTRAYVGRLLAGAQAAPTHGVLAALAEALRLRPAERLQLYAAAGLVPSEVGRLLTDSLAASRLLTALAAAPAGRRERLERLLTAALEVGEPAAEGQ